MSFRMILYSSVVLFPNIVLSGGIIEDVPSACAKFVSFVQGGVILICFCLSLLSSFLCHLVLFVVFFIDDRRQLLLFLRKRLVFGLYVLFFLSI